jgi:hypothetical protein
MKYDAKMQRIITKDWKEKFSDFKILKPRRIIRRNGPLLVGICLERTSDPNV